MKYSASWRTAAAANALAASPRGLSGLSTISASPRCLKISVTKACWRAGTDDGQSVDDRKATHDDRRNHYGHADGQIDSRGQDDKGLSDGQNANDRHLGQHGRKIGGGDEVGEIDGGAEQHAEHQHDERDDRRVRMEEALDALNGRKRLVLERGLRRRCASALEFLRRGPPLRGLAHGALPLLRRSAKSALARPNSRAPIPRLD